MEDIAGISETAPCQPADEKWYGDPEVWCFLLRHYLPIFAVFNLLWEIAQLPLYTLWTEAQSAYIVYAVLHCTAGDVLIGFGALLTALIATRAGSLREWRWVRVSVVAVLLGLAYTAFSEWTNTVVRVGWVYSEWMPILPVLQIGLSPVLQWLVVPTAVLTLSRRRASSRSERRSIERKS